MGGSCKAHVNDAPFLFFSCWSKLLSAPVDHSQKQFHFNWAWALPVSSLSFGPGLGCKWTSGVI